VLIARRPAFDNSPDALRPRNSAAYSAVAEIKQRLQRLQEPLWVLITGRDESEVLTRLKETETSLAHAVSNQLLTGFTLPTSLWPNPPHEQANRPTVAAILTHRAAIHEAILNAGFTSNSLPLTENIFRTWEAALETPGVFWPTNDNSRWILEKLIARNPGRVLALGLLYPDTNAPLAALAPRVLALATELSPKGVYVSGWEILGNSVFARVKNQFWRSSLANSKVAAVFWPASSVARNAVAASRIDLDVVGSRAPVGAIANATVRARATRTGRRWNRDARWLVVMRGPRYSEP
jgi:hypothetical protein